jgi:hypothetical protein
MHSRVSNQEVSKKMKSIIDQDEPVDEKEM